MTRDHSAGPGILIVKGTTIWSPHTSDHSPHSITDSETLIIPDNIDLKPKANPPLGVHIIQHTNQQRGKESKFWDHHTYGQIQPASKGNT
jgi:hypothetical protein